ncbi:LysM peptidoglycan-binding domain-containing protein [Ligilactobacillus animalis]|uniref:C40 family peptidase n=1 Tax=Ligilactobacillus animalis TaxID=1605 RepID=UPI0029024F48|nr:LysM peptidoglycan-binding domain-containing protein [Ligilactobacillus animalis]MDU1488293.1 LysM peptidoglycan-binding domain-containing protein [Ligilactobacillus animalis]
MNHTAKKLLVGTVGAAGLFLATTATANADTTHKVAKNDTVWDLSQKYGVSIQAIEALNNIDQNSHLIVTGQTLKVPAKDAQVSENNNTAQAADKKADTENTSDVTVKAGDTLWTLAQQYNTSVEKLRELNGLATDAYLIHPGNVLRVNGTVQATQQPAQTEQPVQQQTEQPVVQQEATQEQAQEPQLVVSANHTTHTVQAGESLYSIAQAYGVTVDSLRSANNLGATLLVGQTLTINDPAKDPAQEAAAQQAAQEQAASQAQQEAATQQAAQEQAAAQAQQQVQQPVQNQAPAQTQTQAPAQQTQQVQQQAQPAQVQQPQQQVVSTSADGSAIAAYAQSFIGTPYVWGGSTPSGFDCSGLTQYVYAHFGKQIGRNTIAQESAGTHIPVSQAQVGDLLFWGTPGSTYHVAIYLGGNSFVAAPEPGQSVKIGNMAYFMPSFAVHVN